MKNKWNILLLIVYLITAPICAAAVVGNFRIWTVAMTVVPSFCTQLLLCRVTKRVWLRLLPILPILALLAIAGFYFVRDSGWDRLGALIVGVTAIAPAVGVVLGWGVWALCLWLKKDG